MPADSTHIPAAPAARAQPETVDRQSRLLARSGLLARLFDSVNEIVLVLNRQRQIVLANRHVAELLGVGSTGELFGRRPGEAIGCAYACQTAGGCGTSEYCTTCGAVEAILSAQAGQPGVRECRILRRGGDALDLLVRTTPLRLGREAFTVLAALDISDRTRRRAMERAFFHDLLNTVSGLRMLADSPPQKLPDLTGAIRMAVRRLVEEIASQRDLMAAEAGELAVQPVSILSRPFLADLAEMHRPLARAARCRLRLERRSHDVRFAGDATILARVIGNMVRNAVEACAAGEAGPGGSGRIVTLGCSADDGAVRFSVHNPGFMPRPVQLQVFKRSFSTKGPGRGLGTYSMRLLTERYLRGSVAFTSTPEGGTTFTVACPIDPA